DGMTGSEAAPGRGATLGEGWVGATFRCMPRLRPAPNRLASATSVETSATAVVTAIASTNNDFMRSPGDCFLMHTSNMEGDNARRKVVVIDAIEACIRHHRLERLLVGMDANRFRE